MTNGIAHVFINGVEVGSLPADQYHHMVAEVYKDRRFLKQQISALMMAIGHSFIQGMSQFSAYILLSLCIGAAVIPTTYLTQFIQYLMNLTAGDIAVAVSTMGQIVIVMAAFATIGTFVFGIFFKPEVFLRSKCNAEIHQWIREILEVSSEGELRVSIEHHSNRNDK